MRLSITQPALPQAKKAPNWLRYTAVTVVLILAWQLYVTYGGVNPLLVASPLQTLQALIVDVQDGQLPAATVSSLQNLVLGIAISAVLGVLLASLSTFSRTGHDILTVLTATLNPLPGVAILPLAMLWFGLTPTAIIVVVVHSALWPIALSTDMGFRTISQTTRLVAQNLGLSKFRTVVDIYLPAALPHILTGLRQAWAFGWRTVVAAELIFGTAGSAGGLGWYISNARYFLNTPPMFAGLVIISLLGIVVDGIFLLIERSTVVKWGVKQAAS
ncbi:MAG TPA: ABC transporter permease [Ktedonobacteraceae bacterium]|nr:ABC transporter permease [Ktedonobacteraceae bacterium]